MTHRFDLLLKTTWPTPEAFFDLADRLHEVCDDASVGVQGGVATAEFGREADSLAAAVASATNDARAAGFTVVGVRTDESEVVAELNARIIAGELAAEPVPA